MDNPRKCEFFTKQFQKSRFLLNYEAPHVIGTGQCGNHQIPYIIYRTVTCLWWLSILCYSGIETTSGAAWLTFLTNWSLVMLTISTILQLCAAAYHLKYYKTKFDTDENDGDHLRKVETPLLYKITWVVYTISSAAALLVTITYFGALYEGEPITFLNAAVHAVNGIYVIIDIFITGIPIRILHTYMLIIYGLIYIAMTLIHWAAGGSAIYPMLDWEEKPGLAAGTVVIMSVIGAPCFQLILFFLYWLRVVLYLTLCGGCSKVDIIDNIESNALSPSPSYKGLDNGSHKSINVSNGSIKNLEKY